MRPSGRICTISSLGMNCQMFHSSERGKAGDQGAATKTNLNNWREATTADMKTVARNEAMLAKLSPGRPTRTKICKLGEWREEMSDNFKTQKPQNCP